MVTCQAGESLHAHWHHLHRSLKGRRTALATIEPTAGPPHKHRHGAAAGLESRLSRRISMSKQAAAAPAPASVYAEIDLGGDYALTSPTNPAKAMITLPGDVHTALLDAGLI